MRHLPLLAATAVLGLGAAPVAAESPGVPGDSGVRSIGQSFTAPGTPNSVLQSVTVSTQFFSTFPGSVVGIFAFDNGRLVGSSLFTRTLEQASDALTVRPNLALAPGSYAIAVSGNSRRGVSTRDEYAGGYAFVCGASTGNSEQPGPPGDPRACAAFNAAGGDLVGFSVQFGSSALVTPEPATLALTAVGLAAAGVLARRRRAATL